MQFVVYKDTKPPTALTSSDVCLSSVALIVLGVSQRRHTTDFAVFFDVSQVNNNWKGKYKLQLLAKAALFIHEI